MWTAISATCISVLVLMAVIVLAMRSGKATAQQDILNKQAKERQNASKVMDIVRNKSINDVRARLQNRTDN